MLSTPLLSHKNLLAVLLDTIYHLTLVPCLLYSQEPLPHRWPCHGPIKRSRRPILKLAIKTALVKNRLRFSYVHVLRYACSQGRIWYNPKCIWRILYSHAGRLHTPWPLAKSEPLPDPAVQASYVAVLTDVLSVWPECGSGFLFMSGRLTVIDPSPTHRLSRDRVLAFNAPKGYIRKTNHAIKRGS